MAKTKTLEENMVRDIDSWLKDADELFGPEIYAADTLEADAYMLLLGCRNIFKAIIKNKKKTL